MWQLEEPTARGLAGAVSRAIGQGALAPGTKLPPIRQVARETGLSPTTVSAAWQLLARSGAIHTDGRRGTTVAEPRATGPRRYRSALSRRAAFTLDLSTGVPDPSLLPDLSPALRRAHTTAPGSYLDEPVLPELEKVLRERWPSEPERLTIVDGAMDALDRVASHLLRLGDRAIVENPCFPPLLDLLDALGVETLGVDLDADGPVPAHLAELLAGHPVAVFLQPRAQNPTGASWTTTRTAELATILAQYPSTVVIEDDSAGDISSAPAASLGTACPDQTVHIRSFSKSHGPDLRLAALSGPASIVDPVLERRLLGQGWTSRLLQTLLLDLLTDPAAINAVTRARKEYARRRRLVTTALRRSGLDPSSSGLSGPSSSGLSGPSSSDPSLSGPSVTGGDGINLWLPVADEQAALVSLAADGIGAAGGTAFLTNPGIVGAHLRVTVGLVASGHADVARSLAHAAQVGTWTGPR